MRRQPHLAWFFDVEPDLLRHVPEADRRLAHDHLVVERVSLHRDARYPAGPVRDGTFGLLVIDGLMSRRIECFGRRTVELLGPGDVIRAQAEAPDLARITAWWQALAPTELAVLDQRFLRESARWSAITAELLDRIARRTTALGVQLAIAQMPRLESRVLCLFWYLGQRWGTVTPDGVVLRLPLTHEMLAGVINARRSSVSAALARLRARDLLQHVSQGEWLLSSVGADLIDGAPGDEASSGRHVLTVSRQQDDAVPLREVG